MNFRIRAILLPLAVVFSLGWSSCAVHTPVSKRDPSSTGLLSATSAQLIDRINSDAAQLQTMQATVDIDASVGGEKSGNVTDYTEIRGYVLARKPSMLRMIGLLPVVRNKAFDMVSDGDSFRLWIPPRNKFVTGKNAVSENLQAADASGISAKGSTTAPESAESAQAAKLENLRPQHIYDALLIRGIDPQNEIAVLDMGTERIPDPKGHRIAEQPDYEVLVLRQMPSGWYLSRKIIFSRSDLQPHRQIIYDERGAVVTEVGYEKFAAEGSLMFPRQINIWRPKEEYRVVLNILKLQLNLPLADQQFQLDQPAGAIVVGLSPTASRKVKAKAKGERVGM